MDVDGAQVSKKGGVRLRDGRASWIGGRNGKEEADSGVERGTGEIAVGCEGGSRARRGFWQKPFLYVAQASSL